MAKGSDVLEEGKAKGAALTNAWLWEGSVARTEEGHGAASGGLQGSWDHRDSRAAGTRQLGGKMFLGKACIERSENAGTLSGVKSGNDDGDLKEGEKASTCH
ncbi:unnamed protein product [Diplocarpon coronariae]